MEKVSEGQILQIDFFLFFGTFLIVKISIEIVQEPNYLFEVKCRVVSLVVTSDCLPFLSIVTIVLQLRFFSDVAVLNVHFETEFALMRKL